MMGFNCYQTPIILSCYRKPQCTHTNPVLNKLKLTFILKKTLNLHMSLESRY